jgi:hypothetical protein
MKDKLIIITVSAILIVIGVVGGYFIGEDGGKKLGYVDGYDKGKYDSYEKGYSLGYDNGKEFVVTHLDQYVKVPKAVGYNEVLEFLNNDATNENKYSLNDFDCTTFSTMLKSNANKIGIKCAVVSFDMYNTKTLERSGHAINCFETTDRGTVYFDPQTDGQRYDIRVGGTYVLQGVSYKITKVDVIW